jgi:hypothetical protein
VHWWGGLRGNTTSKEAVLFVEIPVNLPADEIIPLIVGLEPRDRILSVDRPITSTSLPRTSLLLGLRGLGGGSKNPRSIPKSLCCYPCSLARNSRARFIFFFAHAHPDPRPASRPIPHHGSSLELGPS